MRLFLCIEILLFFISILQTCRKTHRKCTGTELIGKVGGMTGGERNEGNRGRVIFVRGNVQQVVNGLACEWLETMEEQI